MCTSKRESYQVCGFVSLKFGKATAGRAGCHLYTILTQQTEHLRSLLSNESESGRRHDISGRGRVHEEDRRCEQSVHGCGRAVSSVQRAKRVKRCERRHSLLHFIQGICTRTPRSRVRTPDLVDESHAHTRSRHWLHATPNKNNKSHLLLLLFSNFIDPRKQ